MRVAFRTFLALFLVVVLLAGAKRFSAAEIKLHEQIEDAGNASALRNADTNANVDHVEVSQSLQDVDTFQENNRLSSQFKQISHENLKLKSRLALASNASSFAAVGGRWRKIELCPRLAVKEEDKVGTALTVGDYATQITDQANNVLNCAVQCVADGSNAQAICNTIGTVASPLLAGAGAAFAGASIAYTKCSSDQVRSDLGKLDDKISSADDADQIKEAATAVSTCVFEDAKVGSILVGFFGGQACAASCTGLFVHAALTGPIGIGLGAVGLTVAIWQASVMTSECNRLVAKLNEEIAKYATTHPGVFDAIYVSGRDTVRAVS